MLDQYFSQNFWQYELAGNSILSYFYFILIFLSLLIALKIIQVLIIRKLRKLAKKTTNDVDDTLVEIVNSLKPPFYSYLAFWGAVHWLKTTPTADKIINFLLFVIIVYQTVVALQILIDYLVNKNITKETQAISKSGLKALSAIIKWILWAIALMLILSNLGVNINSLIAGLGIGGLAVALALQNILTDLFSSFSIYFDKPFVVGDFIVSGKYKGTVQRIGIKTTRIQSLQGEEIVISNRELTKSPVQNFGRLKERRVTMILGVTYETPNKKLREIPNLIQKIIESQEKAIFERTHFKNFADWALEFEIVYTFKSNSYVEYLDTQQTINLAVKEAFEKEGIEMAYPTQTIHLTK